MTGVTDWGSDLLHLVLTPVTQKVSVMFHSQRLWRLPPDIQLEVETLIADLRGETSLAFRSAGDAVTEAPDVSGSSRHERAADLSRFLRLRRFVGGSRTNQSQ